MDFLTQDTPVWLTISFFLLGVMLVMLMTAWVLSNE
jgi:type VI protein secretion system component VasF